MTQIHDATRVLEGGAALKGSSAALILLHGRGGSAREIMSLGVQLELHNVALLAPEAANHSWYPNSFLAPLATNQPWLDAALSTVEQIVQSCLSAGVRSYHIALLGFSQGACLSCEFVARNPRKYGALIALTGGLIGPAGSDLHHFGSLAGTPILLSSGDPDPHVPWERVEETAAQFTHMGASVQVDRYPRRRHVILPEEMEAAIRMLPTAFR